MNQINTVGRCGTIIETAFRNAPPWTKVGKTYNDIVSFEKFGELAGLTTWEALESSVEFKEEFGEYRSAPDHKVLFRSDNAQPLGVVGKNYKPHQPKEIYNTFKTFADYNGLKMSAAGALQGGRKLWALAQMPGKIDLGGDVSAPFLLMTSSLDGSLSTEWRPTWVRFECSNMLQMAIKRTAAIHKQSHRSVFKMASAEDAIAQLTDSFPEFIHQNEQLANFRVTSKEAAVIIAGLLNKKSVNLLTGAVDGEEMDKVRNSKAWQSMMALFSGGGRGSMLDSSRNTAYGILQAATEFYDHHAKSRSDENRFISGNYGVNNNKKQQIFKELVNFVS